MKKELNNQEEKLTTLNFGKKGIKAAAILAVSTMLGLNVACSNASSGGNEIPNDPSKPNPEQPAEQENKYIFTRHQFLQDDDQVYGDIKLGNQRTAEIQKYMKKTVKEFATQLKQEDKSNALIKSMINMVNDEDIAFMYNSGSLVSLNSIINKNNQIMAPYMAQIIYQLDSSEQAQFRASFDLLANRACRDSMGADKDNSNAQVNRELSDIQDECTNAGLDANDYDTVEDTLYLLGSQAANKLGVQTETVKMGVDLALLNAGIHGAKNNGEEYLTKLDKPAGTYTNIGEYTRDRFNGAIDYELIDLENNQLNSLSR